MVNAWVSYPLEVTLNKWDASSITMESEGGQSDDGESGRALTPDTGGRGQESSGWKRHM